MDSWLRGAQLDKPDISLRWKFAYFMVVRKFATLVLVALGVDFRGMSAPCRYFYGCTLREQNMGHEVIAGDL